MASRSSASSHPLTDHEEIKNWAEERGARPACVRGTGGGEDVGMIRLDFPGYSGESSLEEISWDDWFQKFDESNLALLVQDTTARGQQSNFNKLVSREAVEERESGDGSRERTSGRSRSTARGDSRARRARASGGRQRNSGAGSRRKSRSGSRRKSSSRAARMESASTSARRASRGSRSSRSNGASRKKGPKSVSRAQAAAQSRSRKQSKSSGRRAA